MILKAIFSVLLAIPKLIISLFPSVSVELPEGVMNYMSYICKFVGYFIPVKGLVALFMINFSIEMAHIVWSIILRIKSFIPTMGN